MPKKPTDFSRCVIYKIICNDDENFLYVGSTTDFIKRKCQHKSNCNNENDMSKFNLKLYKTIREKGGWDNFIMLEIEKFPECVDRRDAERREQKWIDELKSNLNMVKSFQTEEQLKEHKKQYYEQNAVQLLEQKKQYYEQNAEQIREKRKQYYEQNAEQIREKAKQKFTCDCGSIYIISYKSTHNKTAKHIAYETTI